MTALFDPFVFFKAPWSGDVLQRINSGWFSPTFNFAGDAKIEERVVSEVASYGKQIGWLSEIVLAQAKGEKPVVETVAKLAKAVKEIEEIKKAQNSTALRAAIDALEQLKKTDPAEYDKLIRDRNS
jgi:hypothetical protein